MLKNNGFQLLSLLLFIVGGLLAFNVFTLAYFYYLGFDWEQLINDRNFVMSSLNGSQMMVLLLSSHLFGLIIPAWLFSECYNWKGREMQVLEFQWKNLGLVFFFLLISYPLVGFLAELNAQIPLPAWAHETESEIKDILKEILDFNSPSQLIIALVTISIIPAIGEEWIFRGILQGKLYQLLPSPWLAILISSFIFSLFHFQFEGFLPRFFLGWVLGFLFFTLKNLWYPIFFHLIFNGSQVITAYFYKEEMMANLENKQMSSPWYVSLMAAIIFILASIMLYRNSPKNQQA